ncbi:MAG: alpha/beta fold hydrolase [Ferrovibrio sp.]
MTRVAILLLCMLALPALAQPYEPGPKGSPEGPWRRQIYWVPSKAAQPPGWVLVTQICRPSIEKFPGNTPAPLMLLNHGSPANAGQRPTMKPYACDSEPAEWFLARGYVVAMPMRRGYGETSGPWLEEYGRCSDPDFHRGGLPAAEDMDSVVRYLETLPFVQPGRTVIVGQSAGGWGSLAYASRNPPGVVGIINFAGGRGGWKGNIPNNNCEPQRLIDGAGRYGVTARLPTLWIYTQNDSFFAPAISQAMHARYAAAGGVAEFHLMPAWGKDGHSFLTGQGSSKLWGPLVERFLAGLPKQ